MTVLVTGGAGFIGAHTVRALLAQGTRVRVLDNFTSGKPENLPTHPALELMVGDVRDPSAVRSALPGIDAILHLAAQVSVAASVEDPLQSADNNITGYLTVLDAARHAGIRRCVHASSAAVYGIGNDSALDENAPTQPLSPYGLEKLIDDQYAALYRDLYQMSTLGLRYFNVYGPGQDPRSPYSGVISIFNARLRRNEVLNIHGDGGQTRDFIYIADIAAANVAALHSELTGICNIATGHNHRLLDLVAALAEASGHTPQINHTPARSGDIRHSAANNQRLCEQLGLRNFTPLADGLRHLWNAGD